MGDRIAIMRAGRLVQYDTPEAILARPADAFVEEFVGSDRVLKRLSLLTAGPYAEANGLPAPALHVSASATLRDALTLLLVNDTDALAVTDGAGQVTGTLTLSRIRDAIREHGARSPAAA
jgi:osmoprotectant transport system ATP-binding protein